MNFANLYLDLIVSEREWSWSIIGIGYLVLTMVVRQLIFKILIHETKEVDPNFFSAVKALYLKKSPAGWILFTVSFILVITAWINWKGFAAEKEALLFLCLALPAFFFLSVILHLLAFSRSLLANFRQKMGVEKEF